MKVFARSNQHRSASPKIRRSQRRIAGALPGGVVAGLVLLTLTACGSGSSNGGAAAAAPTQLSAGASSVASPAFCGAAVTAATDGGNIDFASLPGQLKNDVSALIVDLQGVLKVSPKQIAPTVKKELAGVISIQKVLASHGYSVDDKTQAAMEKASADLSYTDDVLTKYVNDNCANG
jgi:hypothetical protein